MVVIGLDLLGVIGFVSRQSMLLLFTGVVILSAVINIPSRRWVHLSVPILSAEFGLPTLRILSMFTGITILSGMLILYFNGFGPTEFRSERSMLSLFIGSAIFILIGALVSELIFHKINYVFDHGLEILFGLGLLAFLGARVLGVMSGASIMNLERDVQESGKIEAELRQQLDATKKELLRITDRVEALD
jgi:hypothetical protein